jgi:hypothetical protein
MIIFGFGKQTVKEYGDVQGPVCERRGHSEPSRLLRARTRFTLYFIPIIPYRTEYLLVCPVCHGAAAEKDKKAA